MVRKTRRPSSRVDDLAAHLRDGNGLAEQRQRRRGAERDDKRRASISASSLVEPPAAGLDLAGVRLGGCGACRAART